MSDAHSGSADGTAGAREPGDWQPIEAAPDDGHEILMCCKPNDHTPWRFGIGSFIEWQGDKMLWDWPWGYRPTHWMPIPRPPQGTRAATPPPHEPEARQGAST